MEHQIHFNRKFYLDKEKGYWISTDEPKIRAHRWVWINTHGVIPKGYHIHHKDENKSNNDISNLELIEKSRHIRHHMTEEKREWSRRWVDKIRPMTKAWHASEEGRTWHRLHALKCNFGKGKSKKYKCKQCGVEFESVKKSRTFFCCNVCKSKFRRDSGIDDVIRKCEFCDEEFKCNKYSEKKHCSKKCGDSRYLKLHLSSILKI